MKQHSVAASLLIALAVSAAWCLSPGRAAAQLTAEQAADMLLTSARKAFNEKNHAFAATRFREFLAKFPGHKEAPAARFGLALALLEGVDKNFNEARDHLTQLVPLKEFPEHGQVLYHLALALRGQGVQALQLAETRPPEAPAHRANAQKRFEEAAAQLAAARVVFEKSLPKIPDGIKGLPAEHEWVARTRCDQAEVFLRLQKPKEAIEPAQVFLADAVFVRSQFKDQGRYYLGFASFLVKDLATAEKALSVLTPFSDPAFGAHARYLLARAHHLADERAEAAHHYEGTLAEYAKRRTEAVALLKAPAKFGNDPVIKAQLEAFLKEPPADHVARSAFYLGVLQFEAGKFGEAQGLFNDFPKSFPASSLRGEAELRLGFCQVQLKNFADAQKTLTPLVEREPRLADQALLWLARARAGAAPEPAANKEAYQKAMLEALALLRQAADRAQKLIDADPEARGRRGQILLEIADTQQHLSQHRDAAASYNQILAEKLLPDRTEEAWQRFIQALHLAGDYNESDNQAAKFQAAFSKSTLLPAVLFTLAENSYFRTGTAEKIPNPAERAKELARIHEETIKRFQTLLDRFPEYPKINLARYSLGLTLHRKGDWDKSLTMLDSIPLTERGGELVLTSYLLADCLMRVTPATLPDDALAAGKMEDQLKNATRHLEAFIGAAPTAVEAPDALLKLGLTQQRLAALMAQPPEKAKAFAAARAAYDRLLGKEFAGHAAQAQAVLERAKVMGAQGDMPNAMKELQRFLNDPLRNAQPAPVALVHLATLLRGQNKANDAADVLAKAREQHEGNLGKDPERIHWIALLRYHHGVALREAGKLPEARGLFDLVIKQFPTRLEAGESALRLGQCLKDEGQQKIDTGRKLRAGAKKPEDFAVAAKLEDEGFKFLRDSVGYLEGQAESFKKSESMNEIRCRMLYDAAWGTRGLAEPEIDAARNLLVQEMLKKLGPAAAKLPPPVVTIDQIPLQPAEKKARALYGAIIGGFADLPLAIEARFELAELFAQRNEHDAALKLLGDALDKEPGPEMTDKVRLRIGVVHSSKGNLKAALAQFDAVAANPKSTVVGWAHYYAGEAYLHQKQYPEAIKRLVVLRDHPSWNNVPGLTDRALFRLGFALAMVRSWEESRQANERVVNQFPGSPWTDEARYGIGWALQHVGRFDEAVNVYGQVTSRTAAEVAAKSQFQIGLCRLEQKRFGDAATAFLVVPFTYDYPDLSAAALLEAGRALAEDRQTDAAIRLLERVVRDYPASPWGDAAQERLKTLKK